MSILKVNEIQVFNGTTVTITATTTETSADLNVGADLDVTGTLTLGTALAIAEGGTGATDAATARINLDVDQAGTDNSTDCTLVTTSHDYLSIAGQAITLGPIDLTADVTGSLPYASISGTPTLGTAAAEDVGYFATAAQGALADSAVQPGDDANTLGSGAATDGYVLTADGAGGTAWEAASGAQTNTTNTFSVNQIISVADNTNAALRITQTGTGNALVVEDSANPDSTPFVVDASGNVGIGTGSPSSALDVTGTVTADFLSLNGSLENWSTNAVAQLRRVSLAGGADSSGGNLSWNAYYDGGWKYIDSLDASRLQFSNNNFKFYTAATGTADNAISFTQRMSIDGSGNVDIANLGTGTVYSNSGVLTNTNPSDINLKENVVPIQHGLDSVNQLNPIEFDWIADETDKHEFGFIAQEVQQVIPDLVSTYEYTDEETQVTETRLGLESTQFIPVLVKALQEANAKIDALETRIEALEV